MSDQQPTFDFDAVISSTEATPIERCKKCGAIIWGFGCWPCREASHLTPTLPEATAAGRQAIDQVAANAETCHTWDADEAGRQVVAYLTTYGETSGESITDAIKATGNCPHDDRAFGAVYQRLSRQGKIEKVGTCKRRKGHGTSGAIVWGLCKDQVSS